MDKPETVENAYHPEEDARKIMKALPSELALKLLLIVEEYRDIWPLFAEAYETAHPGPAADYFFQPTDENPDSGE